MIPFLTKDKLSGLLESRYFIAAVLILTALISFFLGRISGLEERKEPVRIYSFAPFSSGEVKGTSTAASAEASASQSGQVVASKTGTKYHYPWCAGAKQISEKNKIYFDSIEAARAAGYSPASNCKGLK